MSLDLNLLRVFDAVYTQGSVSRAATELELSQPAVSQCLSRLRRQLGDPLFVRSGNGVAPTARAIRMAPGIHDALHSLQRAVRAHATFEPAHSQRVFHLHMTDIGEGSFLPPLLSAMRQAAPQTRIETLRLDPQALTDALHQGRVDLAFGYLPGLRDMRSAPLFLDRYIVLLRAGHRLAPALRQAPSCQALLRELEFITVRTHEFTLTALKALHLSHLVRLTTEHFMALPEVIERSDLAVIMPLNIARSFAGQSGFCIVEVPLPGNVLEVDLHWSARQEEDPGNRWLRGLVLAQHWSTAPEVPAPA